MCDSGPKTPRHQVVCLSVCCSQYWKTSLFCLTYSPNKQLHYFVFKSRCQSQFGEEMSCPHRAIVTFVQVFTSNLKYSYSWSFEDTNKSPKYLKIKYTSCCILQKVVLILCHLLLSVPIQADYL